MNKTAKKIGGITLSAAMAMSLVLTAAPTTPVSAATTCTVYFDNSDSWDEVYVYYTTDSAAWSDAGFTDSAISDSNGDGWYEFEISLESDGYVIFVSDTSWGAQTCNIYIPEGTTEGWVAYADYENGSGELEVSTTAPEGFSSTADKEDESEISETSESSENSESSESSESSENSESSESTDSSDNDSDESTQTGDVSPIAAGMVALIGCAVIIIASKRRAA